MKVVLLSAVLGLAWALQAQAEVPVQPGLDVKQFSGFWYLVALGSDSQEFLSTKDKLKMSVAVIKSLDGGNLNIKISFLGPDGCQKMDATLIKESQEGHYSNLALAQKDVRVVATDYVNFGIIYVLSDVKGTISTTIQLYSRTQDVSPEGLKKFKDFYPTVGLRDDMMAMLPKSECIAEQALKDVSVKVSLALLEAHLILAIKGIQEGDTSSLVQRVPRE
ncbi:lipocalin-15-like [Ornithorhynchus anatinus]|uniref:lipocalin-15-like n=1 Tax=Ornithorhynchus anatinus TaxID=9258 RepID=UPI0019D4C453|nr:lipocalin-15-like [Ornithorhynchus anatinus]